MINILNWKKIVTVFVVLLVSLSYPVLVHAQTETPTDTPTPSTSTTPAPDKSHQINDLNNKIKDLESKVSDLKSQEDSLSSQISTMDNQIKLTEYKMNVTKEEIMEVTLDIDSATKRMGKLENSLTDVSKVLINRIVATYKTGGGGPMQLLFASSDVKDLLSRSNYLKIVQEHDKRLMYDTQQARNDYSNQKNIFENKKKQILGLQTQLEDYSKELDQQKGEKQRLLSETQGNEANYQRLLQQARAQLAGFSRFAQSQGGASLLGGQTSCDGWGCYYNQRDSQWGGSSLNGTEYTIASDGCLVTSMAMVMSHYGKQVTPADINGNSSNFASYYPAYLLYTISAGGATAQRVSASIDSTLSGGNPVIVGIRHQGGTHFLVLKSGSDGNYVMNDPFTPNGHDINFSDYYSVGSIFEVDRVQML